MKPRTTRDVDTIQCQRISTNMQNLAGMFARPVGGSGSDWRAKGDVTSECYLIEAKDKMKPSKQRTIYRDIFDKIKKEAMDVGKIPLYVVGFGDGDDFFILKDLDFYNLLHEAKGRKDSFEPYCPKCQGKMIHGGDHDGEEEGEIVHNFSCNNCPDVYVHFSTGGGYERR